MITIHWNTRAGRSHTKTFPTSVVALQRLDFLDKQEKKTVLQAPTDTGDVRWNYQQEGWAIRRALLEYYENLESFL